MGRKTRFRLLTLFLCLLTVLPGALCACGGDDGPVPGSSALTDAPTEPVDITVAPVTTATPEVTTIPPLLTQSPITTQAPYTLPVTEPETSMADTTAENEETFAPRVDEDPTDFEALRKKYPHAVAYLSIPDTTIQYPIVCHPTNDAYYLNHNEDGSYSVYGSLFIEKGYNSVNFDDTLTIIYGHNMGASQVHANDYFGSLQRKFSDKNWAKYHQTFTLYVPGETLEYRLCAAVPFTIEHVLFYYNPSVPGKFDELMDRIYSSKDPLSFFGDGERPKGDKPVLILSTCKRNDNKNRFFVVAELISRTPTQGGAQ